jgi:hypothetical protein
MRLDLLRSSQPADSRDGGTTKKLWVVLLLIAIPAVVLAVYFPVKKNHSDSAQRYVRMGAV